jgi:hypothetical protein
MGGNASPEHKPNPKAKREKEKDGANRKEYHSPL